MPPNLDALLKQHAEAKRAQHRARLAWQRALQRLPKNDPQVQEALRAYKVAKAVRQRLDIQIARAQNPFRVSQKGLDFLVAQEGFIPYAYNDSQGHATFGVGHLLHHGPVTAADRAAWGTKAKPKPRSLVLDVLRDDLEKRFERAVRDAIRKPLKQHQFDALVSFAFNIGAHGFRGSTAAKRLNAGDFSGAADAMLLWRKPPEIIPRRRRERELFLNATYG
ncbi:MAG: lysozyme [Actinomycetota bacterium]|nr:lysozyme [Actinomycetota bacterium]